MSKISPGYPWAYELSQEHAKLAEWLIGQLNARQTEINVLASRCAGFELRITELEAAAEQKAALDDGLRPAFGAVLDAIVYIADMEGGADRRRILQTLEPLADYLNREGEREQEGMTFSRLHVSLMNELAERGEFVGWPNDDVLAALGQLRLWGHIAEGWQGDQPRWWLTDVGKAAMEAERERVQRLLSPVGESDSAEPMQPTVDVETERLRATKERRARLDWLQRETLRHGAWSADEITGRKLMYPLVDADAVRLLQLIPHKFTVKINQGIDGFGIRVIEQSEHGDLVVGNGKGETFAEAVTDAWVTFKAGKH